MGVGICFLVDVEKCLLWFIFDKFFMGNKCWKICLEKVWFIDCVKWVLFLFIFVKFFVWDCNNYVIIVSVFF